MVPAENNMGVPIQVSSSSSSSAAAAEEEEEEVKVLCVIRDMTCSTHVIKHTMNLPASSTTGNLILEVAKQFGYVAGSFVLVYERAIGCETAELPVHELGDKPLAEICTHCGDNRRNNFIITEKEGASPQRTELSDYQSKGDHDVSASLSVDSLSLGASALPATENKESPVSYSSSYTSDYSYSYSKALIKSDTGYVGLVNQAMTCYLNSLLQTLFMTPEFRNAVYRWGFDGPPEEEAKSIPFQLQRLFIHLQTSKKRAVETTDVTKSFGWDSSEAWQQHDVQELCRVMFDALEQKWKNTDQHDLINRLYQGKMKDYVKCLECGYESARTDAYLDIPLVIRPFGATTAYGSVEEALNSFVQPETLDASNQYFCERCNKKCDAHKGLKFVSFPYLLTMQLKRFDFDYNTMHRIKLNDKMTFPEVLNLNHLVDEAAAENCKGEEAMSGDSGHGSGSGLLNGPENSDEAIDEGIDIENCASGTSTNSDTSSISSEAAANDRNARELKSHGPYEYELFSIMIHSGSAAGGHYYAYIKSFIDGQWYSFNDQHVTKITYDDIRKTYGGSNGSRGYYSAAYASSTNAYMLMFRQIDKDKNADFMQVDDFPDHLKNLFDGMQDREEAEKRQKEIDKSTCKIKLFCNHPVHQKMVENKLEIHKDKTLTEATQLAHKAFELEGLTPLECCRLVKYDEFHDSLERSYEGEEETVMGTLLGGIKSTYMFDLLLEIRHPEQTFQVYKPGGVTVKVYRVDLEEETIHPPVSVRAYLTQTVTDFKALVAQALNVGVEKMRCVLERYCNDLRLLLVPNKTLKAEGFTRSNKVFVECSGLEEDPEGRFAETRFYKMLDRYANTIRIHVSLPPMENVAKFSGESESVKAENGESIRPPKSSQSQDSIRSHDLDEGIGDSEIELKERSPCNSDSSVGMRGGGGAVKETASSDSAIDIHSIISASIVRQNMDQARDMQGEILASPAPSSSSTATAGSSQPAGRTSKEQTSSGQHQGEPPVPSSSNTNPESWDVEENYDKDDDEQEYRKYLRATLNINTDTGQRSLAVYVDKRISLGALKKELVPYVGSSTENFKIYRVYSNNQEFESTRLSENLSSFGDDSRLNVKLGRALKKGEYRVKVYQLLVNDQEPSKFLIDTIFAKGMTVLDSKKLILPEVKGKLGLDLPADRCRLRKKTWKNPGTIYVDNQVYDDDIPIYASWEIFVEVLNGPERLTSISQLAIFAKRWRPSKYELEPFQEIVLEHSTVEELKEKLQEVSGITAENIEFAKGRGTFPCEVSLLEIHQDLEWNPAVSTLNVWPLYICDDGNVIYYRDSEEELAELTEEKKKEIQQKESARLSRVSQRVTYSPRKERALKIYTDDHPNSGDSTARNDH